MALLALGINHKTAPVEVRERVAFAPEQLGEAMADVHRQAGLQEVAILSTCNRTELYCAMEAADSGPILEWIGRYHELNPQELADCSYIHQDEAAVRHMMRVACGLDSLVLGEPQILGQLKSAFAAAQEAGMLGPRLGRLFRHTFSVAKQVRTETAIGQHPVSVAYAAVNLAQHIFADLEESHALLIGAGETIELVARHLHQAGVRSITVANRTLGRARALADQVAGEAIELAAMPRALAQADILISSTASQLPILGKGAVETALKKRKHRPMFMVDIAVPRDIEPQVAELDDVYLYTVDDLTEVIEENQRSRESAAAEAEAIIEAGTRDFLGRLRELQAVGTLTALRARGQAISAAELDKALRQLQRGADPEQLLRKLAHGITNKMLHQPTVQLRKASADGRTEFVGLVQELYQLDEAARGDN